MKKLFAFLFPLFILFGINVFITELAHSQFVGFSNFSFNFREAWSASESYSANDAVVGSDGKLYVATGDIAAGGTNPGDSGAPASLWAEAVASAGPRGPQGVQGQQGPRGLQGNPGTDGSDGNPGATGARGPIGPTGQQGPRGLQGIQGNPGNAGADGVNGYSTRLIYRKINTFDYTGGIPVVTYNGTRPPNASSLTLPTQWSLNPYVSQTFNNAAASGIDSGTGRDIVVDPDTDIIYIVRKDTHGNPAVNTVRRYNFDGTTTTSNSILRLNSANMEPVSIALSGSRIYILDSVNQETDPAEPYKHYIFVYDKTNGGYQTQLSITTPLNRPVPRAITIQGSYIYAVSPRIAGVTYTNPQAKKAIRVFNLQGVEQDSLGRETLPTANDNPVAIGSDDSFLYILDGTDDKVYAYGRVDPDRRYTSLEFDLQADSYGVALSEFVLFTLNGTSIYRYYNPQNTLWASALFIQEDNPYNVIESNPFWMTARRTIETAGSVTIIQGGGTGGTGTAGVNGSSIRYVFRAIARGTTPSPDWRLSAPTGGSYTASTGPTSFIPPTDWHLSGTAAESGITDPVLYVSVSILPGDSNTVTYQVPFDITGPRGPPGPVGDSITFVYKVDTSRPAAPTGGTWDGTTLTLTSAAQTAGWSTVPVNPSGNQNLYLSEVTLPGSMSTSGNPVTYKAAFEVPRGADGSQGPRGTTGVAGPTGLSFRLIFRESTTEPSLPTGGTWNNRIFRAPTNWLENSPRRSVNDPENLYATGVELPGNTGTPHYTGVFQLNGEKGDPGDRGPQGTRGDGNDFIFQVSDSEPAAPSNGSGTWNPTTDTYTPPSGWSLDSSAFTGTNNLYTVKVTLPGSGTTETYGSVFRLNGQRGTVGPRGPPGVPGGSGGSSEDGDSLTVIYKTSTNLNDPLILGQRPSGGSWDHATNAFTIPSGWTDDPPSTAVSGTYVFMAVATLHGEANTISYDLPVRLSGEKGDAGTPGTNGNDGATGPRGPSGQTGSTGNSEVLLYQNSPAGITPTDISQSSSGIWNSATRRIGGIPGGWSQTATARTGTELTWLTTATINGSTNAIVYSIPIQLTGNIGPRGQQGSTGGGTGTAGNSLTAIYTKSTTAPSTPHPAPGQWNHMTNVFIAPNGWSDDSSNVPGTGRVYISIVRLSGTSNDVLSYSRPDLLEGQDGQDGATGPRGPQGIQGPAGPAGPKGDTGARGTAGQRGKFFIPVYQWSINQPSDPNPGRYDGGFIHNISGWERSPPSRPNNTEQLWQALIEVNADNTTSFVTMTPSSGPRGATGQDGARGPAGPQGNPGPAGTPGTNGTNGDDGNSVDTI